VRIPSEHDANSSIEFEWNREYPAFGVMFRRQNQVYTRLVSCTSKTSVIPAAFVFAKRAVRPQIWTALGDERHLIMAWHEEMDLSSVQYCCQLAVTFRGFATIVSAVPSLVFLLSCYKEHQIGELNVCMLAAPCVNWQLNCMLECGLVWHRCGQVVSRYSFDATNYVEQKASGWESEEV
jgi:hypothetical protein